MRYDLGDKKLNTYAAVWNHTGPGGEGGWNLTVIEWIGNYEYSEGGELISHSHERITTKTYSYFPSVGVDREYAYSMVFEPKWNPPVALSGNHSEKNVTYYDSYYRTDGDHQPGIDEWRKQNPLVEIRDVYDPNTRHILVSSEEGFKNNFEDGWWNDVALKLNPKTANFSPDSVSQYLKSNIVVASTWSDTVRINLEKTGSSSDSVIQAKQVDKS